MLKVGNEDVKKIMVGNVEIENIAIGDETIPVESGTPAEPIYYIQISGGTKQELSGGTYEGFINPWIYFKIFEDDLDISSALTCECTACQFGTPPIYYDEYYGSNSLQTQLPLNGFVVDGNSFCPEIADAIVNVDGTTYSVPYQAGEPGVWEADDFLFIPEEDIPEGTPITISLDGVNYLEIHWYDQSTEQDMIETAYTRTCVIPAGSYLGFHSENYGYTYIVLDDPLPSCGAYPAYIAMYNASIGNTRTEELDPNGGTIGTGGYLPEGSLFDVRKVEEGGFSNVDFHWQNDADGTDGVNNSYVVMSDIREINYDFDTENGRYNIYFYDEPNYEF